MDQSICYAVMVRVEGPDPKGLKRKDQSFSLFDSGTTTLSASGLVTQLAGKHVIVTTAHIIRPYLVGKSRYTGARGARAGTLGHVATTSSPTPAAARMSRRRAVRALRRLRLPPS